MSYSVRVKVLLAVMCFFWAVTGAGKMQAAVKDKREQVVIAEHSGAFGMLGGTLADITFPLLQTAALYGTEIMMEGHKPHNFMGQSYSEMTATSAGLAAGNAFANTTVTALNHGVKAFTLAVEPIAGKQGWIIKLIPDGSLLAVPVMFGVYYSAHNKNYNFYSMDARGTVALYTGNAALGLGYAQIERAINKGFELMTGRSDPIYGTAATSLVTGLAIGLLATRAKVDIASNNFNVFSVLSTALAVGHTVAYSGKAIRFKVKSMLVNQNISKETADKLSGVAVGTTFMSTVMLLTAVGSKIPTGLKNYHGKVIGDMTKNIGLILSVDLMQSGVQLIQDRVHSTLDHVEEVLQMPEILRRISFAAREPAMILISHQLLVRALTGGSGDVRNIRLYDIIIGFTLGGFVGGVDNPRRDITKYNWDDHAAVWGLAALSTFIMHSFGRKPKVD